MRYMPNNKLMFTESQVVCVSGLSIYKKLLAIFYLVSLMRYESKVMRVFVIL